MTLFDYSFFSKAPAWGGHNTTRGGAEPEVSSSSPQAPAAALPVTPKPCEGGSETPTPHAASGSVVKSSSSLEPSTAEKTIARQKAEFVHAVWTLTKTGKLKARDAAVIVANDTARWPLLQTGGKNGASLLQGRRSYNNYRAWLRLLGRDDDKKPNTDNFLALAARYKGSRPYVRPGPDAFWTIFANLYEHENKLSMSYAYELAVRAWQTANPQPNPPSTTNDPSTQVSGLKSQVSPPSYNQVHHHYDRHVDPKRVSIARNGEKHFLDTVADHVTREAPLPGVCWFSDHHIFDAAVKVWDDENGCWRAVRPWITAWQDWGSLYFEGYIIRSEYPNRDAIERALRQGIEKCGGSPPQDLYIDNGKDYQALGFAKTVLTDGEAKRLASVAELLGCTVHFALPYNARSKVVERTFRVVCEQFSKLWTSYRGSNPQQRPESADLAWKNPETLPTLDEFVAAFEAWLHTIYHDKPSNGKILDGQTPRQVRAQANRRPALEPMALYKAFLREVPGFRKIGRGGKVTALKRVYRSEDLWHRLLSSQDQVRVKVDPDNLDLAWIYDPDGREIGPAQAVPTVPALIDHNDTETIEQLREEMKRGRRQLRDAKAASAAARDLARFRKSPGPDTARSIFDIPTPQLPVHATPAPHAASGSSRVPEPKSDQVSSCDVSADDMAALDAALREQTQQRLNDLDDDDIDLADFEAYLRVDEAARLVPEPNDLFVNETPAPHAASGSCLVPEPNPTIHDQPSTIHENQP